MDLQELLSYYIEDPRTQSIKGYLQQPTENKARIHLDGLSGSLDAFIATAVFKQTQFHHWFICSDKESAAYFQADLANVFEHKDVLPFPDSFKKPGYFKEPDNNNVLLRTECIKTLHESKTRGEIVVSYPEALLEKVVQSSTLNDNTIYIQLKEQLDVDFVTEVLINYGFEHVDFVYNPGQFSVRGGIVDIFSFAHDMPYRVELFDDEVESIRTFDPTSQLSVKKLESITIVPNIQTHFANDEKVNLFDALPENTIFWIKDFPIVFDTFGHALERLDALQNNETEFEDLVLDHPLREPNAFQNFLRPQDILAGIQKFDVVETGRKPFLKVEHTIRYQTKPQPAFNKNFQLLIEDLQSSEKAGRLNFIFAENAKQIERFYHIFQDLNADCTWHPVVKAIHAGFIDENLNLSCYTDHQIFNRYHKYSLKKGYTGGQAMLKKTLKELQPGDYVTHIDHGVGVYRGLQKIDINGQKQEAVRIEYTGGDLLYVYINSLHKLSKYSGKEGHTPRVNKLGSDAWGKLKSKTKKKIKDIAEDLIKLYAKRKSATGFAFSKDTYLQTELEASFLYEDTPDQFTATEDVKADMEKENPMDRLICGDVGFGKTEVAIRAAFKAITDGKQVAVLVPTTILALQHYKSFSKRLEDFPVTIEFVNRFKTAAQKKAIFADVKEGKIDILIGTHAIASKQVGFKDLGLLIVDEEQKFGVAVKEKLRTLKANVDTLTLTATPIPRTMQFSLMGARDFSVINTPPPNRQPVTTEVHPFNPNLIKEAIEFEVYRGGQVFFVHNRVKNIMDVKAMLQNLIPNVDVGIAHGQMKDGQLEKVILEFMNREHDVLLCTNIIETGIDIPNANTIIINDAHMFGLSDLHQLRGRVGRSNKKAFCYLFSPPFSTLTQESRQRLKTIEQFAELGSGFNIAMRDLDIRGAGNLLGGEQSGFIAEIGYDMYHKILDEAVQELKEGELKELLADVNDTPESAPIEIAEKDWVRDTQIDSDLEMLIPDKYVRSINERLALYAELNNIETEEGLATFSDALIDRFGPLPKQVLELFNAMRLKWTCKKLGLERIIFKNRKLRCYFPENQQSPFYQSPLFGQIIQYVQKHPNNAQLKQTDKYLILIFEGIKTMQSAHERLLNIKAFAQPTVKV